VPWAAQPLRSTDDVALGEPSAPARTDVLGSGARCVEVVEERPMWPPGHRL
jgi:hypothetical protein